jgi:ribosomal protein L12E/L44/L45/RPP1/RPP2
MAKRAAARATKILGKGMPEIQNPPNSGLPSGEDGNPKNLLIATEDGEEVNYEPEQTGAHQHPDSLAGMDIEEVLGAAMESPIDETGATGTEPDSAPEQQSREPEETDRIDDSAPEDTSDDASSTTDATTADGASANGLEAEDIGEPLTALRGNIPAGYFAVVRHKASGKNRALYVADVSHSKILVEQRIAQLFDGHAIFVCFGHELLNRADAR